MTELSDEMLEAIAILRSDERAKAFRDMTAANQALVQRLDKKDADDAAWRKEWAERATQAPAGAKPEETGGTGVGDKETGQGGPEEGTPQPPAIELPVEDKKPKNRSRWFGDLEDD